MTRNQITTADCLNTGDRFYLQGDKKKQVFEVVEHIPLVVWYCPINVLENRSLKDNQKAYCYKSIKNHIPVVFLRSK